MSILRDLEKRYRSGTLPKEDYISEMHAHHLKLWDYLEFIKEKNIANITLVADQVIVQTKDGIKMICDQDDERIIPIEIINFGDYETAELVMMRKFLQDDSVLLDIGANIGWYCLNLASHIKRGRILAFEPIAKTFKLLQKNLQLNGISNVELYNFGLSNREDILTFYYDPKLSGATSLRVLHEDREKTRIECPVKKLDDLAGSLQLDRIDFIKCDVEGGEKLVLEGAVETIKATKPVIFLEMLRKWSAKFGYHPNEIISLLKGLGYACYYVESMKLVEISAMDEHTVATNFYFLHPQKHRHYMKELV